MRINTYRLLMVSEIAQKPTKTKFVIAAPASPTKPLSKSF